MNHWDEAIEGFKRLNAEVRARKLQAAAAVPSAPKIQAEPADPGEALRGFFKSQRDEVARAGAEAMKTTRGTAPPPPRRPAMRFASPITKGPGVVRLTVKSKSKPSRKPK